MLGPTGTTRSTSTFRPASRVRRARSAPAGGLPRRASRGGAGAAWNRRRRDAETRYPASVESAAYFVVSGGLTNVAKYARARTARVTAADLDGRLHVEVTDDGVGSAHAAQGSGLMGLQDRVAALDGTFRVDSPVGDGTRVAVEIPVRPDW